MPQKNTYNMHKNTADMKKIITSTFYTITGIALIWIGYKFLPKLIFWGL